MILHRTVLFPICLLPALLCGCGANAPQVPSDADNLLPNANEIVDPLPQNKESRQDRVRSSTVFDMPLCRELEDAYFVTGRQFDNAFNHSNGIATGERLPIEGAVEAVSWQKAMDRADEASKPIMAKIRALPWTRLPTDRQVLAAEKAAHEARIEELSSAMAKEDSKSTTRVSIDAAIGRHQERLKAIERATSAR